MEDYSLTIICLYERVEDYSLTIICLYDRVEDYSLTMSVRTCGRLGRKRQNSAASSPNSDE